VSSINLIDLPTQQLLEKFGAGGHKPGSGSAAALSGILAAKLIVTVATLTRQRDSYVAAHRDAEFITEQIKGRLDPALSFAFQRDAEIFDQVIIARRRRDEERDPVRKRELADAARDLLQQATEIPLGVCRDCLRLVEFGLSMFDIGFKSARGDSGTAVSATLAGAFSALFIVYLNLRSFRSREWTRRARQEADDLMRLALQLQDTLFSRVTELRGYDEEEPQLQLPFAETEPGS
jgi:formiminotetrahydrofolate cyclodeaminase